MRTAKRNALAVIAAATLWGSSAVAAPVTTFLGTPITAASTGAAGAFADDPALNPVATPPGYVQNLMSVTTSTLGGNAGGADWTNSFIRITLSAGKVYNATAVFKTDDPATEEDERIFQGTVGNPQSGQWGTQVEGFPTRNGRYDSFVNSKGTSVAAVTGGVAQNGSPTATFEGLDTNNATVISAQWGNTVGTDTGAAGFSIGRFTLSTDAVGTFFGQSFDSLSGGVGTPFSGSILAGSMSPVPEPGALAVLTLAAGSLLGFRRRRHA